MSPDTSTVDSAPASEHATPPGAGLQLDKRQRAMLEAMGITLWQPESEEKQAVSQLNRAQAAAQSIATSSSAQVAHTAPIGTFAAPSAPARSAAAGTASPLAAPAAPSAAVHATAPIAVRSPSPVARPSTPAATSPVALQPRPSGIEYMDWLPLQNAIATCQACPLCASRKNTVFGMGQPGSEPLQAPRADWLIVGEAPSEDEDATAEPFAGAAGKLLDKMLRAMVVDGKPLARQHNVFITNVLKCRPPADRNPSAQELAMCQPYLLRQIALLQPKIILAMGRFAMQALIASTEPLGKLRGRAHALQGAGVNTPVIVTYHPAYLLRNPGDKAKAWADLLLAMETLQSTNAG